MKKLEAQLTKGTASCSSAMAPWKCITPKKNCWASPDLRGFFRGLGYPAASLQMVAVEEQLLLYSNEIRLTDDLTFIEVRF